MEYGPRVWATVKRTLSLALVAIMPVMPRAEPEPQQVNPYAKWQHGPPKDANFFPIAVWLQSPGNARRFKNLGFNLYVGLWERPTAGQLATLKRDGMPVFLRTE
jgi:hypothetical protein